MKNLVQTELIDDNDYAHFIQKVANGEEKRRRKWTRESLLIKEWKLIGSWGMILP